MTEAGQGYDINWVLSEVGAIRNSLNASAVMATDLGVPGWTFPTTVYTDLYGLPAGTKPPTSGHYPHAFTKGQWLADGSAVDPSKDGECTVEDAMPQWMDCGIPCPVTEEARMAPEELTGFSVVVVAFMFLCAIIGAVTYFMVGKSSVKFFVGGRNLNLFVMTATIASQSLDANAALGNIDLGYNYHWWDGACLPLGLGGALLLNGIFFAKPINEMKLTRPAGPLRAYLRPGDGGPLLLLSDPLLPHASRRQLSRRRQDAQIPLWPAQRVGGNRDLCVRDLALHRRGRPPLCRVHRLRSGHHRLGGPRRRHHLDPQQHAVCGRRLCGLPTR